MECLGRIESPVKDPSIINLAEYRREAMSDTFDFYWRVLRNSQELEAVMVVKGGTSYAGVGWRPLSLTAACKGFPYLEDLPENLSVNVTETDFEPQAEPEPVTDSEDSANDPPQSGRQDPADAPQPEPEPVDPSAAPEPEPTSDASSSSSSSVATTAKSLEPHHDHDNAEEEQDLSRAESSNKTAPSELTENPSTTTSTSTAAPTTTTRAARPKIPILGRSPSISSTSKTTAGTTTTTTTTSAPSDAVSVSSVEDVVSSAPPPAATSTTTKKMSPLDRLIAKNKLASARTSTTTTDLPPPPAVEPSQPAAVAAAAAPTPANRFVPQASRGSGSVTRLQLSDLPESGISTNINSGAGSRRSRRDAGK